MEIVALKAKSSTNVQEVRYSHRYDDLTTV